MWFINYRLYNKLPEVKEKKKEEEKKRITATNREKAKQFQKVHMIAVHGDEKDDGCTVF